MSKRGSWESHIADIPECCRPDKTLIFNLNNHGSTARVDVSKDGSITWVAGGKDHGFLSLSGIVFPPTNAASTALPLAGRWQRPWFPQLEWHRLPSHKCGQHSVAPGRQVGSPGRCLRHSHVHGERGYLLGGRFDQVWS